eukprot:jgi/Botrbrau1/17090/Bobra.0563s0002.1
MSWKLNQDLDSRIMANLGPFDMRSLCVAAVSAWGKTNRSITSLKISTLVDNGPAFQVNLKKCFDRLTDLSSLELHTRPQHGLVSLPESPAVQKSISLHIDHPPSQTEWHVISSYCSLPGLSSLAVLIRMPPPPPAQPNPAQCSPDVENQPFLDLRALQQKCPDHVAVSLHFDKLYTWHAGVWACDRAAICTWTNLAELHFSQVCQHRVREFSPLIPCLTAFTRLQALHYISFDEDDPLQAIAGLESLTSLRFSWVGARPVPLLNISSLHRLKHLSVSVRAGQA